MEFLTDYGMFLAKAVTIVLSIGAIVGLVASTGQKNKKGEKKGSIKVNRINEHIDELRDSLRASVLEKEQLKVSKLLYAETYFTLVSPDLISIY